jgi:hypothetical protein
MKCRPLHGPLPLHPKLSIWMFGYRCTVVVSPFSPGHKLVRAPRDFSRSESSMMVVSVARRQKGLFDTMSAGSPSTILPQAVQKIEALPIDHAVTQSVPAKRVFRPCALGFIGLAIAVALWGFGYKLSRYTLHPDSLTRTSVAKLWDKHQDAGQVIASKLNAEAQLRLKLYAVLTSLQNAPEPDPVAFRAPDDVENVPSSFRSLIPFRSPPSRSFQV